MSLTRHTSLAACLAGGSLRAFGVQAQKRTGERGPRAHSAVGSGSGARAFVPNQREAVACTSVQDSPVRMRTWQYNLNERRVSVYLTYITKSA